MQDVECDSDATSRANAFPCLDNFRQPTSTDRLAGTVICTVRRRSKTRRKIGKNGVIGTNADEASKKFAAFAGNNRYLREVLPKLQKCSTGRLLCPQNSRLKPQPPPEAEASGASDG